MNAPAYRVMPARVVRAALLELVEDGYLSIETHPRSRTRVRLKGTPQPYRPDTCPLGAELGRHAARIYAHVVAANDAGRRFVTLAELEGRPAGTPVDEPIPQPAPARTMIVLPGDDTLGAERIVHPVTYLTLAGELVADRGLIRGDEIDEHIAELSAAGWEIDDRRGCPRPVLIDDRDTAEQLPPPATCPACGTAGGCPVCGGAADERPA